MKNELKKQCCEDESFKNCFLFKGLSDEQIEAVLSGRVKTVSFKKGDIIFDKKNVCRVLGIVLKGEVEIYKTVSDSQKLVLNTLSHGQVFGAASLFCQGDAMTQIAASKNCTIAVLERDSVEKILSENFKIALNYLKFMSDRVCFLNKKIDSFTASTPEERLALYLLDCTADNVCDRVHVRQGISRLAQSLNIGRASLYRAIEALESDGIIARDEKCFVILKRAELEKIAASGYKKPYKEEEN